MKVWIPAALLIALHQPVASAFAVYPTFARKIVSNADVTSTCLLMGKKKPSMKERMARRSQKKIVQPLDLPPSKLDFKTPAPKPSEAFLDAPQKGEEATTTTPGLDPAKKITDPASASQMAKNLLKAQRDSVAMLTSVKESIEKLPATEVRSSLDERGYYVADNFLGNDETIADLLKEGAEMLSSMEIDMSNIGSGEYTVGLKGGDDQYSSCPRLVETVVSATKHGGAHLKPNEIDDKSSMAFLRTFDRKAFKASLALLTGGEDEQSLASTSRPFEIVAVEENDQRKLSLFYYMVPESWNDECGGGITFQSSGEHVAAAQDRLVIFNSDSTQFQKGMWKGNDEDGNQIGSRLELHLVKKRL